MPELWRSYAMSHLPYSYELPEGIIKPFVLGHHDVSGDSIAYAAAFSETRGHYWLWKNVGFDAHEFVSVQQYRRCFWFPPLMDAADAEWAGYIAQANKNLGQQILHMSRPQYIRYVTHVQQSDPWLLSEWLSPYDIVVGRPIQYPKTIGEIYGEHHRSEDWEIFAAICRREGMDDGRHPWLTGHLMFMMRPDIFDEYMTLWWRVFSEVDALVQHETHPYQHRKIGYLTERFVSAWLIKIRTERPSLRILALPICEGLFQFDRPSPNVM